MAKMLYPDAKNIVLRVPNWIGDAVMCLPGAVELRRLYPGAHITVVAKPWTLPVFENNPELIDGFIEYDSKEAHAGFFGQLRLAREMRERKFDLAVLFQNAFEAAFLSVMAGIPARVGYAKDLRSPLLTDALDRKKEILAMHQVFYYMNIVKEMGGTVDMVNKPVPEIRVSDNETGRAYEMLKEKGVGNGAFLAGIAPGASFGPSKRWHLSGFKQVAERLSKEYNAIPVIFGGGEDAVVAEELSKMLGVRHINFAGRTKLREFFGLAKIMDVFVTNDSGPMHVAAALGTPTVGIFGWTEPGITGALGKNVRYISKNVDCKLCHKRECPYGHHKCMDISSEEVFSVVRGLLGR